MKYLLIISLLLLLSCNKGLDDDRVYVPVYKASFFLIQNISGEYSISCISKEGVLTPNWQKKITSEKISHFVVEGSKMYISLPEKAQILQIDLTNNSISTTINWQNAYPTSASIGKDFLLILDSKNNKIAYFKRKNTDFEFVKEITTHDSPVQVIYHSIGRFYVQIGKYSIGVFDENTLSETNHYSFNNPIIDLTIDGIGNLQLLTNQSDSTFYGASISVTNRLATNESIVAWKKIRYSPFIKPIFETEYLGNVSLINGKIQSIPTDSIHNFEIDFRNSNLFYQRKDTLYQYNLQRNNAISNPFLFENNWTNSAHYYEQPAN